MCQIIKITNKHTLPINNSAELGNTIQVMETFEAASPAADNKKHKYPKGLCEQAHENKDNGLHVNYILAPENFISGLRILPKSLWSCEAVKTSNFNDTEFKPILPRNPLNKGDLVN